MIHEHRHVVVFCSCGCIWRKACLGGADRGTSPSNVVLPLQLTQARAEEFYGEHKGKDFFPRLVSFMTSGPIWALVLAKPGAILGWRALMGPTNVFKAREEQPKW